MYLVLCNVTHTSMWALSQVFKLGLQGLTAPQTFISGPWGFVECHPTFVCTASCVWCVGVFVCGLCGWLDACMRACVRVPSPLLHGCVYIHMAVISLPSNASPHVSKELYTNNYQEVDDSTTPTSLAVPDRTSSSFASNTHYSISTNKHPNLIAWFVYPSRPPH